MTELSIPEVCLRQEMICMWKNNTWVPTGKPVELMHLLPSYIQDNYLWFIMALGLPGNMAAILTMALAAPATTATFLVALLAAVDSAAIVMKLLVNRLYDHHYLYPTVTYCRCLNLTNVCSSYANWVLVLIAVERLVAVVRPLSRGAFMSRRKSAAICCLLFVIIFSFHAPFIIFRRVGLPDHPHGCYMPDHLHGYTHGAYPWINMLLYSFLPILLLFFITMALCVALGKARRRRSLLLAETRTVVGDGRQCRSLQLASRSERTLTLMMVAASVLLMVLLLPQCLFFILIDRSDGLVGQLNTPLSSREELWRQIVTVMADSTHALNFYIYFVSVASFRRAFVSLIRCRRRQTTMRSRDNTISGSTHISTSLSLAVCNKNNGRNDKATSSV